MAGPIDGADAAESLARECETQLLELAERRYDAYMADVVGRTLRRLATATLGTIRARARRRVVLVVRTLGDRFAPPGTDRRAALGARFRRLVPSSSVSQPHQRRIAAPATLSDDEITARLEALMRTPTVDVVVVRGAGTDATLASVRAQRYPAVESIVVEHPAGDTVGATGSVEATVNAAVAAATGEFVVVLEAGDRLAPHALIDLVAAIQDGADAAYGDEDRVDDDGDVVVRDAKPLMLGDETLLSYDVVGAPLLVRRSLFCELGGLDERCHPVAAHDFALRLSEATDRIEHVAEVLCSRPESNAADPADATAATIDVVRRAIERRGGAATVWAGDVLPSVRFTVAAPDPAPSVAIVIPTRDRLDLLRACVESVRARSTYPNYSILICDNDSKEPATLEWLEREDATVVRCPGPFNYAAIVNRGVAHTDADFVVTLNNDTTIATPDWLERLVGLCSLPKVGSVGVKLAYPDGRLQHEGVGIIPMPVHLSRDVNYDEVDRWLTSTRNAAAVTGACQIVRSTAWRELGGLDEQLAVGYNDVDFCLRLGHAGWRVAYTPEVVVEHRESASRGNLHPIADVVLLVAKWDLLSSFADPCVPGAVRDAGRPAGSPSGPRAHTGAWPVPRLARPGEPTHERAGDAPGAAPSSGVAGWTSRHVADAVRQVLDDRPDPPVLRALAPQGSRRRGWLRGAGARGVQARRGGRPIAPYATRRYRQYYAHTRPSASALRSRTAALDYLEAHPTVSVVVAIGPGEVSGTLESLRAQVYDRTEVLAAGGSKRAARDGVVAVGATGSVEATVNAAVAAATGEFVVVLEAGDRLAPHALIDLVAAIQDGADAAYGDEDRVDDDGEHGDWHLKPAAYGRITALSYDVVGAPLLVRRSLFCELGGLDERCHPVAAHDFALRLSEATDRIEHVAEVLCSRPESNAADPADATAATIDVVRRAIERRGGAATVWAGDVLPSVRFTVAAPDPAPSVAIVIPTRDRLDLLRACVESVRARSTYPNYSILICDNDSKEPATLEWLEREDATVVRCPGPFNYAAIVNRGVAHTDADFVVTLNNDTTIATPDWLERLVGLCSLPKVGSVGVKLAYPDGRLQHEGVGIIPMPVHLSRDVNYDEVDRWLTSTRNAAAVTGACQIVRSTAWRELGGLDEQLAVAFNDVDFGMRLCAAGYDVAYTPEVTLGHRESASRGDLHPPADEALLISRWDLLGGYVDPSMPVAMRLRGDIVEFDPRADAEASR